MARTTAVQLTGEDLTPADVWEIAVGGAAAELDDSAREKMRASRAVVERAAEAPEKTYGVNTGFGRFVNRAIPRELVEELQLRLLRSHACGVGDPYPDEIVRAAIVMRANTLAKGYSGVRVEVAELLLALLRAGVLPHVPSRGSVGASGDLAPLAHLALPLVGEGKARVDGELVSGADALARVGLEPLVLRAKEGLSLVNGTQFMGAFAALGTVRARRLALAADIACALSLEALQASRGAFVPEVHALRPLAGQADSAANILRLSRAPRSWSPIAGATVSRTRTRSVAPRRCTALRATCSTTSARTTAVELNAATDNPLVFADDEELLRTATSTASRSGLRWTRSRWRSASWRASPSDGPSGWSTRRSRMGCGLPGHRRRAQLRLHDPPVRGGLARQREQGALRTRRASTRSRRARDRKITLRWATLLAEGVAGAGQRRGASLAIELLAAAQAVEHLAPLAPGPARARRVRSWDRFRLGCRRTGRSTTTSRLSPLRSATVRRCSGGDEAGDCSERTGAEGALSRQRAPLRGVRLCGRRFRGSHGQ